MDTGSFLGVKWPGPGADNPTPYSPKVKARVELYLYSTSGPSWPVIDEPCLYLYSYTGGNKTSL